MIRRSDLEEYLEEYDAEIDLIYLNIDSIKEEIKTLNILIQNYKPSSNETETVKIICDWKKKILKNLKKKINEIYIIRDAFITALLEDQYRSI